jgi:hypothetical protein
MACTHDRRGFCLVAIGDGERSWWSRSKPYEKECSPVLFQVIYAVSLLAYVSEDQDELGVAQTIFLPRLERFIKAI